MSQYQSPSLYVGDLHPDVTEALLFELFNSVGAVQSIRVCRDSITRRSLGYAYVNFHSVMDAERALDALNFSQINGVPCRIMWSHRDPSQRKSGEGNLFIKNLEEGITHKALYDVFSSFGNIQSCKVAMDENGKSKGFGFVHYETKEEAENAINKVNGMLMNGKKVYVGYFLAKKERQRSNEKNFTNVYVKNIHPDVTEEQLKELFEPFGEITSMVVNRGKKRTKNAESSSSSSSDEEAKEEDSEAKEEAKEEETTSSNEEEAKEGEEAKEDDKTEESQEEKKEEAPLGFGFINFKESASALKAVEDMNEFELEGKKLYVGRAQKKSERQQELKRKFDQLKEERLNRYQGVNVYVKNLDDQVDDEQLRKEFSPFGTITSAKVMSDDKGNSKGFGFVCFSTAEEATKAVTEMNNKIMGQKPIYVALAQRKEARRAQLAAQHAQRQNAIRMQQNPNIQNQQQMMYLQQAQMGPNGRQMMYMPQRGMQQGQGGNQQQRFNQQQQQQQGNFVVNMQNQQNRQQGGQQNRNGNRNNNNNNNGGNQRQQQQQQQTQTKGQSQAQEPLTITELTAASPNEQKDMLGDRLFPMVNQLEGIEDMKTAAKITGMLLEMDNFELLHLLEVPDALAAKVGEAQKVLQAHMQQQGAQE
eukprot:TRINITY_DN408_c3_g1_i1.p1 TRINITY_DN408_c3_g1~~TRINITY_DN408_c3_g1_i1.p1  ORF type:complete len:682 (+),score=327.05 TRINITY_DN408_c3_g1_i1:112-2046(+)